MTPTDIRAALSDIAREQLSWQGPLPSGDLAARLDSMQLLALVVAVEDHFKICLDASDEAQVRTVDDLIAVVAEKTRAA